MIEKHNKLDCDDWHWVMFLVSYIRLLDNNNDQDINIDTEKEQEKETKQDMILQQRMKIVVLITL